MIATIALSAMLALFPAQDAPAAAGAKKLQQVVQEIYGAMQKEMPKEGSPTPEQMAAMQKKAADQASAALATVDLSKLDPGSIDACMTLCRMAGGKKMEELCAALKALAKSPDAGGFAFAVAAVGAMPDGKPGSPEAAAQSKAAVELLAHPGLQAGFKGNEGRNLLMMLDEADAADLKPYAAQLKALGAAFKPDAPSDVFSLCTPWAKLMQRAASPADAEAARAAVLAAVNERLAKTTDEKKQKSLKRMASILDGASMKGQLVGYPAPAFEYLWLGRTDGTPSWKTLADLKGKVVVLDFWATWCGPCVGSFPNVRKMRADYSPSDVEIIGITSPQGYVAHKKRARVDCKDDVAKEQKELAEFMKDMEMTWTVAMTKQDVFNPDFAINGIPFVAIIDADGKVAKVGLHPSNEDEIRKTVDELVARKNAGKKG
jgi:thiol-disulfide isomerase/thioredoxin